MLVHYHPDHHGHPHRHRSLAAVVVPVLPLLKVVTVVAVLPLLKVVTVVAVPTRRYGS